MAGNAAELLFHRGRNIGQSHAIAGLGQFAPERRCQTATPVRASLISGSVAGGAGAVAAQRLGGIGVFMRFSFR